MSYRFGGIVAARIKTALFAASAAGLLASAAPALAADEAGKPVCLDVNRIDHTEVLNDRQILFYMYGKKIWLNTLGSRCTTLTRQEGFAWDSSIPRYCDNLEIIRVIRTGEVCTLGAFTPYEKPAKPS
jgi:hypothetical protein